MTGSESRTRFAVGDEPDIPNVFTARVDTNIVSIGRQISVIALPSPAG